MGYKTEKMPSRLTKSPVTGVQHIPEINVKTTGKGEAVGVLSPGEKSDVGVHVSVSQNNADPYAHLEMVRFHPFLTPLTDFILTKKILRAKLKGVSVGIH